MFGFGKKKNRQDDSAGGPSGENSQPQKPAKKSSFDKLVMGAIVGVAVGSVIGMAVAPKKGSETREIIAQKGKEAYGQGKKFIEEHQPQIKEAQKRLGFFRRIIFGKPKPAGQDAKDKLKRIPTEVE
jgi:gas vesicle protein